MKNWKMFLLLQSGLFEMWLNTATRSSWSTFCPSWQMRLYLVITILLLSNETIVKSMPAWLSLALSTKKSWRTKPSPMVRNPTFVWIVFENLLTIYALLCSPSSVLGCTCHPRIEKPIAIFTIEGSFRSFFFFFCKPLSFSLSEYDARLFGVLEHTTTHPTPRRNCYLSEWRES